MSPLSSSVEHLEFKLQKMLEEEAAKPTDASDLLTLEEAREAVSEIRHLARDLITNHITNSGNKYRSQHRNQKKSLVIVSEKAKDLVDPKRVD